MGVLAPALLAVLSSAWTAPRHRPRSLLLKLRASGDFWGAFPSGAATAYDTALMCLSLEADECGIDVMEDAFRALDAEMVRQECSPVQAAQIDELWRVIKLMYGGASRREAILARRDFLASADEDSASRSKAYRVVLSFLDPKTSASAGCTGEALERALAALDCEGEACLALNEGELQVLEQLRKVVARVRGGGYDVQRAVEATWAEREARARSRLGGGRRRSS